MNLFLAFVTRALSTANIAFSTSVDPFLAGRWESVLPSFVVEDKIEGLASKKKAALGLCDHVEQPLSVGMLRPGWRQRVVQLTENNFACVHHLNQRTCL